MVICYYLSQTGIMGTAFRSGAPHYDGGFGPHNATSCEKAATPGSVRYSAGNTSNILIWEALIFKLAVLTERPHIF